MIGLLSVSRPFIGDAATASETNPTVDNKYFAMRAAIELFQAVPVKHMITLNFHSGRDQGASPSVGYSRTGHKFDASPHRCPYLRAA